MEKTLRFQVGEEAANQRLDAFLATHVGWLSRMRLATLLARNACLVNDDPSPAGLHLKAGDVVEMQLEDELPTAMTPEALPLEIIYEDADMLVVVKPSGMLVHPTRNVKSGTLVNALAYHLNQSRIEAATVDAIFAEGSSTPQTFDFVAEISPLTVRPGLVHRLDRATSGLMLIAKNQRALSLLSRHFHRRLVEKRYLALVHGIVAEDELVIDASIGRDSEGAPFWRVMNEGKAAETRLRVLERRSDSTLVELEPVTGRTNQLRIHSAHIGHPIIGDEWYGSNVLMRLCLHAAYIKFHHPTNNERMEFTSPLPIEIEHVLRAPDKACHRDTEAQSKIDMKEI